RRGAGARRGAGTWRGVGAAWMLSAALVRIPSDRQRAQSRRQPGEVFVRTPAESETQEEGAERGRGASHPVRNVLRDIQDRRDVDRRGVEPEFIRCSLEPIVERLRGKMLCHDLLLCVCACYLRYMDRCSRGLLGALFARHLIPAYAAPR